MQHIQPGETNASRTHRKTPQVNPILIYCLFITRGALSILSCIRYRLTWTAADRRKAVYIGDCYRTFALKDAFASYDDDISGNEFVVINARIIGFHAESVPDIFPDLWETLRLRICFHNNIAVICDIIDCCHELHNTLWNIAVLSFFRSLLGEDAEFIADPDIKRIFFKTDLPALGAKDCLSVFVWHFSAYDHFLDITVKHATAHQAGNIARIKVQCTIHHDCSPRQRILWRLLISSGSKNAQTFKFCTRRTLDSASVRRLMRECNYAAWSCIPLHRKTVMCLLLILNLTACGCPVVCYYALCQGNSDLRSSICDSAHSRS